MASISRRMSTALTSSVRCTHYFKRMANIKQEVDRGPVLPPSKAPHIHAHSLELLEDHLSSRARALDIKSGTGYLTACMGLMVKDEGGKVVEVEQITKTQAKSQSSERAPQCTHYGEEEKTKKRLRQVLANEPSLSLFVTATIKLGPRHQAAGRNLSKDCTPEITYEDAFAGISVFGGRVIPEQKKGLRELRQRQSHGNDLRSTLRRCARPVGRWTRAVTMRRSITQGG